jgi:Flp pilus assembly protein TadD
MKANGSYDAGNFLLKSKKYKEAVVKYREAIALWPQDWHYHYNCALALKHSGNGGEAVAEFRKSLELNEKDWKCWKALGNTYWRLGQKPDAKLAFENALKFGAPPHEAAELHAGIAACSQ